MYDVVVVVTMKNVCAATLANSLWTATKTLDQKAVHTVVSSITE